MKIYRFFPSNQTSFLDVKDPSDSRLITRSLSQGNYENIEHKIINLEVISKNKQADALNDILWLDPEGLICRKRAYDNLRTVLANCGGWNIMQCGIEQLYYFSVTKELDILDEEKSDFIVQNDIVLGVKNYVFKNSNCIGNPIFRMKGVKGQYPLVTEEFVDNVERFKITGLEFKEI